MGFHLPFKSADNTQHFERFFFFFHLNGKSQDFLFEQGMRNSHDSSRLFYCFTLVLGDCSGAVVAHGEVVGPVHDVEPREGEREDDPGDDVDALGLGRDAHGSRRRQRGLLLLLALLWGRGQHRGGALLLLLLRWWRLLLLLLLRWYHNGSDRAAVLLQAESAAAVARQLRGHHQFVLAAADDCGALHAANQGVLEK